MILFFDYSVPYIYVSIALQIPHSISIEFWVDPWHFHSMIHKIMQCFYVYPQSCCVWIEEAYIWAIRFFILTIFLIIILILDH